MLSALSESVANDSVVDNQIVTPPLAKEVAVDIDQAEGEDKTPPRPKRKNSGLVEGGNPKKPSSVKNQVKFRSTDVVNLFDSAMPAIEKSAREISNALAAKDKVNPILEKVELLQKLLKTKQDMIDLGENTDWVTAQIKAIQGLD